MWLCRYAFGRRLHVLIVACLLLAVLAMVVVIYLFDGERGPRFFVGFAVALSFILSLCVGAIQLTASLLKWRALKCSVDLDLRQCIFSAVSSADNRLTGNGFFNISHVGNFRRQTTKCLSLSIVNFRKYVPSRVKCTQLQRLRPESDARDPSVEGLEERGRLLRLVCSSFVGKPRQD